MDPAVNVLSLCAGVGGLDLAVRLAVPAARTVCYAESEAYCCAVLAARMEEGSLDAAPVWTDLRTFDGRPWRGIVDLVVAGFPCPPVSVAGKRLGMSDPRWLWPDIARIVREVRPSLVFLENVPGLLTANGGDAFESVLASLADCGFDAEWGVFSAAEVGAPHQRKRVFVLAHAASSGRGAPERNADAGRGEPDAAWSGAWDVAHAEQLHPQRRGAVDDARDGGEDHGSCDPLQPIRGGVTLPLADPYDLPGEVPPSDPPGGANGRVAASAGCAGNRLADAGLSGLEGRQGLSGDTGEECATPERSGDIPLFPPGPDDRDAWSRMPYRLQPATVKSKLLRDVDGLDSGLDECLFANRIDRLRGVGNGVVSLCGAVALRLLAERLGALDVHTKG